MQLHICSQLLYYFDDTIIYSYLLCLLWNPWLVDLFPGPQVGMYPVWSLDRQICFYDLGQ